jgi:hypothetical protein
VIPWNAAATLLKSTIQSIALEASDPLYAADFQAAYRDTARENVHPVVQLELVLQITSSSDVMTGERFTFDPAANGGNGELISTMHGMRDFTLNVQARSYDLSYSAWAITYLERIRTRIWRSSVREALIANGIAPFDLGPILDVQGKEDGHALSVANLDIHMRLSFTDTPQLGTGWFEKITLTSHVKKPDGTEYPAPPNVTALPLP